MTRNIIKGVSFVLIFMGIFSILSTCFLPGSSSKFYNDIKNSPARGFYGEPKNSLDVIAIGDSNIESSFSPMELWKQYGFTGYTCGEPAQNVFEAYNMLSEVLTCQKPKVVILDVDGIFPLNNQTDTFHQFLDFNLNHAFPIFQHHDPCKIMFSDNAAQASLYQPNPSKGYLYSRVDIPFSGNRPYEWYDTVVDQISKQTLDRFCSLGKKNHIQLVLAYAPTVNSWNQERHDWVEKYAAKHSLPFLDLNTFSNRFQIDWKRDSRDGGTHLNFFGAKRVTLYLGGYLHQHYNLPDHRTDRAFSQWDVDYEKYLKMATPKPAVKLSKSIRPKR